MKLKKLLTLSPFVKKIEEEVYDDNFAYAGRMLGNIFEYNNFLKQPLTKEMFVNEATHPDVMPVRWSTKEGNPFYQDHLINWQKAEKKVLFEGFNTDSNHSDWLSDGNVAIEFTEGSEWVDFINEDSIGSCIKTLHDLSEATKGELTLKNVEL